MKRENEGVVECRATPDSDAVLYDLRRSCDGVRVSAERMEDLLDSFIEMQAAPGPTSEKVPTMFGKVRSYVSDEFKDNEVHAAPLQDQIEASRSRRRRSAPAIYSVDCSPPKKRKTLRNFDSESI